MKPRIDSRSSQIDTERCVDQCNGRYNLVIVGSQRLREMKRRARETGAHVTPIDALLEIQSGNLDVVDYIIKVK